MNKQELIEFLEGKTVFNMKSNGHQGTGVSMYHTMVNEGADFRITGCAQGIEVGHLFEIEPNVYFEVKKINEVRDHAGHFNNPELKKKSFFDVTTTRIA